MSHSVSLAEAPYLFDEAVFNTGDTLYRPETGHSVMPEVTLAYVLNTDQDLQAQANGCMPYFQRLVALRHATIEFDSDPKDKNRIRHLGFLLDEVVAYHQLNGIDNEHASVA